jgi:hypothetical protein
VVGQLSAGFPEPSPPRHVAVAHLVPPAEGPTSHVLKGLGELPVFSAAATTTPEGETTLPRPVVSHPVTTFDAAQAHDPDRGFSQP